MIVIRYYDYADCSVHGTPRNNLGKIGSFA